MSAGFEISIPKRIVFGRGKARDHVAEMAGFGRSLLIVHGKNADRVAWLISGLKSAGCAVTAISCEGEPDLPRLEEAVLQSRQAGIDAVIAIGGGAAMDLGKAVAGVARTTGPVTRYLEVVGEGKPLDAAPLPFVAIPTTSGTGAEATRNAVIGIPSHNRKVSLRDPAMLADLVIVDPALTDGCPRHVTLASGLDAITQLIEPYISSKANAFADGLVLRALPAALGAITRLMEEEDASARDAMSWASLASGMALANAGLGAVHGLAGVIGGMTGAAHGEICATLLPASLTVNAREIASGSEPAKRLGEIEAMLSKALDAHAGSDGFGKLDSFVRQQGIRPIDALGLKPSDFSLAAAQSKNSSSMRGNPVALDEACLVEILVRSSSGE